MSELTAQPVASARAGLAVIGATGGPVHVAERGPFSVAFDGLIFNRDEIDRKCAIDSGSDASRLAALVEKFGIEAAVGSINGSFAAAVYDRSADILFLVRDRFGVKPLYYVDDRNRLAFASRPAALFALDGGLRDVDRRFVATFAGGHYRHIDNRPEDSPFKAIRQLPAAHYLERRNGVSQVRRYWDLKEQPDLVGSEAELAEQYRALLLDAVARRVDVASAPAFALSGGLDSSSVLSCAVERLGKPQAAFSSVYADPTFDESDEIRSMLDTKVSKWQTVTIGTPDVFDLVRRMVKAHDEPVATATWLSHYLLCGEVARSGFGAVFGGLGGDELNAGEYEYFFFLFADLMRAGNTKALDAEIAEWQRHHDHPVFRKSPEVVRKTLSRVVDMQRVGVCLPDTRRMSRYFGAVDPSYFDLASDRHAMDHPFASYLKNRTYQDIFRETAPCCLRAEDRQSEAHGLQHVDPFFDHRLAEFMFRVPGKMKIRDGITKRLLREAMQGILPEETRVRVKKTGWNAPAHQWFAEGHVADALGDLIASQKFRDRSIYNVAEVQRLFQEHRQTVRSGAVAENHMMFFWQLLNLELWFENVVEA